MKKADGGLIHLVSTAELAGAAHLPKKRDEDMTTKDLFANLLKKEEDDQTLKGVIGPHLER